MADKDEVRRLALLFEGCSIASGTHGVPERDPNGVKWTIKRTAQTLRVIPTLDLWTKHVSGERPLGPIPIREDSSCSWGSVDYDEYDSDVLEVVARVDKSGLPLVPCRSKSGGVHLFLFLLAPESAESVQSALRDAAASLGLAGCEIFPKQTRVLTDRNDLGNWMIAPYFGGDYGGKLMMQYGIKSTGAEMTLGEFLRCAEERRTTIERFTELLEKRKRPSNVVPLRGGKNGSDAGGRRSATDFSNGPPCLQHLFASGSPEDGRKRILFNAATYYKRADEKGWRDRTEEANQQFSPPLPSEEVSSVVRSHGKKDYEYQCKQEPLLSHCNSVLCRMRKFGVGRSGSFPEITGISRLDTDPVMWFVDVAGSRLELSTDQLSNYSRFYAACLDKVGVGYEMVQQKAWLSTLSVAMESLVVLEPPPPDARPGGRFNEHLEEFLTNRARGERVEDLLSGRPWEDVESGRHYFTLRALQRFLSQEGVREISRGQMTRRIEALGGRHHFFNLRGRGINCWWVPSDAVQRMGELETPPVKGEDI